MDDEKLAYWWSQEGAFEWCTASAATFDGEICHHCDEPIHGDGVALDPGDGAPYPLHLACANEGCGAEAIAKALAR